MASPLNSKTINFIVFIFLMIAISVWIGLAFFSNVSSENEAGIALNATELLESYQSDKNFVNLQKGTYYIITGIFKKIDETKSDIVISVADSENLIFFSRPSTSEFDIDSWIEGDEIVLKGKLKGDRFDGFNELFDRINIEFVNTTIISHQKRL